MTHPRKRTGAWVQLKRRVRSGPQKARILQERPGITRGAVYLSAPLGGFRWWNKADLVVCTPPSRHDIKALLRNPVTRKRLVDGAVDFICKVEGIR